MCWYQLLVLAVYLVYVLSIVLDIIYVIDTFEKNSTLLRTFNLTVQDTAMFMSFHVVEYTLSFMSIVQIMVMVAFVLTNYQWPCLWLAVYSLFHGFLLMIMARIVQVLKIEVFSWIHFTVVNTQTKFCLFILFILLNIFQ